MSVSRDFNMADAMTALGGHGIPSDIIDARLVSAGKVGDDIVIVTDRGTLRGVAEGDCCSSSWVESVGCDAPAGSVFVDRVMFDDPERTVPEWHDGDERKVYFGAFFTDRGRITWEMRNESNGYYGGSIKWRWEAA